MAEGAIDRDALEADGLGRKTGRSVAPGFPEQAQRGIAAGLGQIFGKDAR
jgi:hypothetical protein